MNRITRLVFRGALQQPKHFPCLCRRQGGTGRTEGTSGYDLVPAMLLIPSPRSFISGVGRFPQSLPRRLCSVRFDRVSGFRVGQGESKQIQANPSGSRWIKVDQSHWEWVACPQINDRRRDHPAFAGLATRVLSLRSSPPPCEAELRSQEHSQAGAWEREENIQHQHPTSNVLRSRVHCRLAGLVARSLRLCASTG